MFFRSWRVQHDEVESLIGHCKKYSSLGCEVESQVLILHVWMVDSLSVLLSA